MAVEARDAGVKRLYLRQQRLFTGICGGNLNGHDAVAGVGVQQPRRIGGQRLDIRAEGGEVGNGQADFGSNEIRRERLRRQR